ncbi:MAG: hypothetical protein PHW13_06860 [Methylococcales bacterium]|nr:hypothetical protein [Methylococcales bacterium]
MSITSLNFVIFALVSMLAYNLLPVTALRRYAFLAINLAFFSTFSMGTLAAFIPMTAFLAAGYLGICVMQSRWGQKYFWQCMALAIASFFWLKKYTFVPDALLIGGPYMTIGLSYIFFRVMQMLIDAGEKDLPERVKPVDYLNFVLNFTTLISGPIQRYQDFAQSQDENRHRRMTLMQMGIAVERIVVGAFKVLVMATIMAGIQQLGMDALLPDAALPERAAAGMVLVTAYTIYLYFNFSGYTDIVIGIARFFGLVLPENFNRPFSATNFMDFWARWHMTLSNWLKFYVYNPLLKNLLGRYPSQQIEPYLGVFAFFFTFFLIGLWHGQTAVFALYGFFLGLGVSGNKLYQIAMIKKLGRKGYKALAANYWYQSLSRGMTFTWFTLSLICFWADWDQITDYGDRLGWDASALLAVMLLILSSLVLAILEAGREQALKLSFRDTSILLHRYTRTAWVTAMTVISVATITLMSGPAPDIVYKNF